MENENPKIPRVEILENGFKVEPLPEKPQKTTFYPKKKKLNDLDKYLIFAFSSLIIFTITILTIYFMTGNEPAVLIGCFFAAFGGEILMCALIKRLKLHKEAEIEKKEGGPY